MSFYDNAKDIRNKIESVLADENLVLTVSEKYPITLIISQNQSPYAQMEFLSSGEDGVSSKDSALRFVFDIDGLEIHTSERLIITDALMSKLKGLAKKFHTAYTHAFFADTYIERVRSGYTSDVAELPEDEESDIDISEDDTIAGTEGVEIKIDLDGLVDDPEAFDEFLSEAEPAEDEGEAAPTGEE